VVQTDYENEEADVIDDTDTGICEEAGSQPLHHLDSGRRSCMYNSVRVKQPPQKVQESAEKPVQEDSWPEEVILTESSAAELSSSLKMGPMGCPESSVTNCQFTLRNIEKIDDLIEQNF